jgi:hypothetical protein
MASHETPGLLKSGVVRSTDPRCGWGTHLNPQPGSDTVLKYLSRGASPIGGLREVPLPLAQRCPPIGAPLQVRLSLLSLTRCVYPWCLSPGAPFLVSLSRCVSQGQQPMQALRGEGVWLLAIVPPVANRNHALTPPAAVPGIPKLKHRP